MKTLYDILGVDKKASQDEIKREYRKLAFKHHPDNPENDGDFSNITNAYSILSNKIKRLDYDADPTLAVLDHSTIVRQRAIEIVSSAYLTIIDTFLDKIFEIPIIEQMSLNIEKRLLSVKENIAMHEKTIKKLKRVKKRIHSTSDMNLLFNITHDRITEIECSIVKNRTDIEVLEESLKILKDYSFDTDVFSKFVSKYGF